MNSNLLKRERGIMVKGTVVILGGGIGGLIAANNLRKKLPEEYKIILVEKNRTHSFAASYLWLIVNKRSPEQISVPLIKLVPRNVELIFSEVKKINVDEKLIKLDRRNIKYDFLIIALGAELEAHSDKLTREAFSFYTLEEAVKLRDKLNTVTSGEIAIVIESLPYKCPGAPFEAAMLISKYFEGRNLKDKIGLNVFTPEPQPLPVAGPQLGKAVVDLLRSGKINFYPLHKLVKINEEDRKLFFENGNSYGYDLLITIPKHKAPDVVKDSGLTNESGLPAAGQAGWIPVNRLTLETKFENVYAIGDVASITLPGRWSPDKPLPLPKAGVFAHSQAVVVSDIIAAKLLGKKAAAEFCADGFCMLEAGEDLAGFAYGNFYGEPNPDVKLKKVGKIWHFSKVLFEKWWLTPDGPLKRLYRLILVLGSRIINVPIKF